jgi:hypothetical protein
MSTRLIISYIAVLAAALVLYVVSCAPGVLWQDSGMIQYRVWHNDIEGRLGLALAHPLFYVLAIGTKYVPVGEFAQKANLLSAFFGAAAVANLFLLVRLWTGQDLPAVISVVTFAVSHTFWQHASVAETYSLYIALFLIELIMMLQYVKTGRLVYLYAAGFSNGLAISNHMLASIPLLCYAVFCIVLLSKGSIKLKHLGVVVLLWVIGAGLYEYLIIRSIIKTGDFMEVLASAAFGNAYRGDVLNANLTLRMLKENFLYILLNFPTPNVVLFFIGCFMLFKVSPSRAFGIFPAVIGLLFFVFAFRYTIVDRYAFFMPFYCVVSIITGLGAHLLQKRARKVILYAVCAFTLLPVPVYAAAPALAHKMQVSIGTKRQIPYRDEYKYFLQPWLTDYRGAERFANQALDEVEENAIIWADSTTAYPLLCVQEVKGKRQDVKIISSFDKSKDAPELNVDTAANLLNNNEIYVVSLVAGYCPQFLLDSYDFKQQGVLWKVVKR